MQNKRILISGAGISGLTLAWWLDHYGFNPVVIEKAATRRRGGYMIDFWALGYDVLEKMGLLDVGRKYHIDMDELTFVNSEDEHLGKLDIQKMRARLNFRHFNFLRSYLEEILFNQVKDKVEIRFNTSIKTITETADKVQVQFENDMKEDFDLVIGTDGLHSNTRNLVFNEENSKDYKHFMGYYTASYTIPNHVNNTKVFKMYGIPEKQLALYSVRKNDLATLFIWKSTKEHENDFRTLDEQEQKERLIELFGDIGWKAEETLSKIDEVDDFYYDSISQVRMENWSKGRVSLVGDACQSVSLIAGEGASLGMAGGYILAGELKRFDGDYRQAFQSYESILKPEVERKQKFADKFAKSFVPSSKISLWFRNKFANILYMPVIYELFFKKYFTSHIQLKDY